ncbi:hypothetical protein CDV31_009022 [Fusarium ambrosium]|uniref:Glucose receptor Git3 N-terminal domain-containing protein n=1 Tax=Fusarium ambrosium TaxID=131363 RepID=A0A428TX42_9HYPO|nr:hypothetical protein CDV31_009022 [Fusarium ambrosium]
MDSECCDTRRVIIVSAWRRVDDSQFLLLQKSKIISSPAYPDNRLILAALPWVLSVTWAGIGLGTAGYGNIGAWCWFTSDEVRLLVNFIPRWVIIVAILFMYGNLYYMLHRAHRRMLSLRYFSSDGVSRQRNTEGLQQPQERPGPSANRQPLSNPAESEDKINKMKNLARRMLLYPLAYMLIWSLPTAVRIYQSTRGVPAPFALQTVDKACIVLQGFIDAVIYGINESSLAHWRNLIFHKPDEEIEEIELGSNNYGFHSRTGLNSKTSQQIEVRSNSLSTLDTDQFDRAGASVNSSQAVRGSQRTHLNTMIRAFPHLPASLRRPLANLFRPRLLVRCYAITPPRSRDHTQNASTAKRKYPGLGLDIRHDDSIDRDAIYPIGIHFNCDGSESEMLLVREVAMMMVMESITDKPDWHVKVFDTEIANKWKAEALALPVDAMYKEIAEDRIAWPDKAFPGQAPKPKIVLDEACVDYCIKELRAKAEYFKRSGLVPTLDASATVVKSDIMIDEKLKHELRSAFEKLKEEQKANPDWHPGTESRVQDLVHPSLYPLVYGRTRVMQNEVVGVQDAISWVGKGEVIPQSTETPSLVDIRRSIDYSVGGSKVDPTFWSLDYQWLPSNLAFQSDGSVKFTSYINNLHPQKHRDIYNSIEKLVERSLCTWDFCLAQHSSGNSSGLGRTKPRFPRPVNPCDSNLSNWNPSMPEGVVNVMSEGTLTPMYTQSEPNQDNEFEYNDYSDPRIIKWAETREAVQPNPPEFSAWPYGVARIPPLRERFQDSGLQIIVKMASIELDPDKNPSFPLGGWHVEGQMNEHIIGTALYYLDSENITPSSLQFRMQTSPYQDEYQTAVDQNSFSWMEQVFGVLLGPMSGGACLQNYGRVETREGRLLAFPNVFHHRVTPFELADKTKPGHRRFIALWLVDPFMRVISTANVPPQQEEWLEQKGIEGTMSAEEAKGHREKLMKERAAFRNDAEGSWEGVDYGFCEH